MKDKNSNITEQLIQIVSSRFRLPSIYVIDHLSDPLNGDYFHFDSIDMVYFVLEIMKAFGITMADSMAENCADWSIQDYAKHLEKTM